MGHHIVAENVSSAWLEAVVFIIKQPNSHCNNLMVDIKNPISRNINIEQKYKEFCENNGIKHFSIPANTIFPQKSYQILGNDRKKLYSKYPKLHEVLKGRWGSYFGQMIGWKLKGSMDEPINQLEQIITKINARDKVYRNAYTIQITNPKDHTSYIRGGPCLHYITLQLERNPKVMNMLALYRNHDFARKAYGNYVGLGRLLEFLSKETEFSVGSLTCVSSNAFIDSGFKKGLNGIFGGFTENAI